MSIEIITDRQTLLKCREQWNSVSNHCPLSSWEWCVNWLQHIATDVDPYVIVETDDRGNWVCIAPMMSCKTIFGENKIYSMGSGQACTDYNGLIRGPANQSSLFASKFAFMLNSFRENADDRIEVVEFDGVDVRSDETLMLVSEMEHSGYQTHCMPLESSWKLELGSDWESLNSRFSKKHRRKTKKAMSRLNDSAIEVKYGCESEDFDSIWNNFVNLHQQRRGMVGQRGCFAEIRFEQFLKSATQQLMQRGLAEIIEVSHKDCPFGSALLFHDNHNAYMYQTGFDPELSKLEPGYLLIVSSLLWSIGNGFETFDFLRGDEPYKARWQTTPVELAKLRFVDLSTVGARIRNNLWVNYRTARTTVSSVKQKLASAL